MRTCQSWLTIALMLAIVPQANAQVSDADQVSLERLAQLFAPAMAEGASFGEERDDAKESDLAALKTFFRLNPIGHAATTVAITDAAQKQDIAALRAVIARLSPEERSNFANAFVTCPKIIGGSCASIQRFPWLVSLRIGPTDDARPTLCGGARISRNYVLTAAHCVDQEPIRLPNNQLNSARRRHPAAHIVGFAGSDRVWFGPQELRFEEVYLHRDWKEPRGNFFAFDHDLALLKLVPGSPIGSTIKIRSVPVTANIGKAWVAGWGLTGDGGGPAERLQAARVAIADQARCAAKWQQFGDKVTSNMLCAGDDQIGFCEGDSGGPLVIGSADNPQLIGVVSWGHLASCRGQSTSERLGKVFARVAETLPAFFGNDAELNGSWTKDTPSPLFDIAQPNDR